MVDDESAITKIHASTVDEAARVLAAAFATDPIFLWMAGKESVSSTQFAAGFAATITAELRRDEHECYIATDGGCVTLWHGVNQWKPSPIEGLRMMPGYLRSFGLRRAPALLKVQAAMEKAHPTDPHYHLAFIGTDPAFQGTGRGSATLTAMLERCDTEGLPAYLESSNPANEAFYMRHGFVVTEQIALPGDAPPVSAMWRDSRG